MYLRGQKEAFSPIYLVLAPPDGFESPHMTVTKGRCGGGHGRAEGGRGGHDGARQGTRATNRPRGGLCKLAQAAGETKSRGEQRIATGGQGRPREDVGETGRPREDEGSHKGHGSPTILKNRARGEKEAAKPP
eukprot:Gb_25153 [translate_table: standard]